MTAAIMGLRVRRECWEREPETWNQGEGDPGRGNQGCGVELSSAVTVMISVEQLMPVTHGQRSTERLKTPGQNYFFYYLPSLLNNLNFK